MKSSQGVFVGDASPAHPFAGPAEPRLSRALRDLETTINDFAGSVGVLEARLGPILAPGFGDGSDGDPTKASGCELVQVIDRLTTQLHAASCQLAQITNRLEI